MALALHFQVSTWDWTWLVNHENVAKKLNQHGSFTFHHCPQINSIILSRGPDTTGHARRGFLSWEAFIANTCKKNPPKTKDVATRTKILSATCNIDSQVLHAPWRSNVAAISLIQIKWHQPLKLKRLRKMITSEYSQEYNIFFSNWRNHATSDPCLFLVGVAIISLASWDCNCCTDFCGPLCRHSTLCKWRTVSATAWCVSCSSFFMTTRENCRCPRTWDGNCLAFHEPWWQREINLQQSAARHQRTYSHNYKSKLPLFFKRLPPSKT